MEIRKVKIPELNFVLDLIDEFDRVKATRPHQEELEDIYSNIMDNDGCVLGAFNNEQLIGTCTLNICQNFSWSGRPYGIIENVIVTESMRNNGIGTALLNKAESIAKEVGCYKVALMSGLK